MRNYMPVEDKAEIEPLKSLDDESFIFQQFRNIPFYKIKHIGRAIHCWRVRRLIRSIFYSRSWIDSSSSSEPPPDFHNDKHHIMMEFMRIDDSVGGKRGPNSFQRTHNCLEKYGGKDYKKKMAGCSLFFVPDTRSNKEYNFKGYYGNFERVLMDHSNKVDSYHINYPKCKTCVLFVCDESNDYYQVCEDKMKKKQHNCFRDKRFLNIIKECKSEYVVWFTFYKEINLRMAYIYDVRHIKDAGIEYDFDKMIKKV